MSPTVSSSCIPAIMLMMARPVVRINPGERFDLVNTCRTRAMLLGQVNHAGGKKSQQTIEDKGDKSNHEQVGELAVDVLLGVVCPLVEDLALQKSAFGKQACSRCNEQRKHSKLLDVD